MPKLTSLLSGAFLLVALGCLAFALVMVKQKALLDSEIIALRQNIRSVETERDDARARTAQVERDLAGMRGVLGSERNRVANLQQQSDRARREVLRLEEMQDERAQALDQAGREIRKLKRDLIKEKTASTVGATQRIADPYAKRNHPEMETAATSPSRNSTPTGGNAKEDLSAMVNGPTLASGPDRAAHGARLEGSVLYLNEDRTVIAFSAGSAQGLAAGMRLTLREGDGGSVDVAITNAHREFSIAAVLPGGEPALLKKGATFVIIVL